MKKIRNKRKFFIFVSTVVPLFFMCVMWAENKSSNTSSAQSGPGIAVRPVMIGQTYYYGGSDLVLCYT